MKDLKANNWPKMSHREPWSMNLKLDKEKYISESVSTSYLKTKKGEIF